MGSGKSVIGRDLSKKLDIAFIDTDTEIEKEVGLTIDLIFKNHGEDYFRSVEEKICLKFLKNENCIISLGGGSVINDGEGISIIYKETVIIIINKIKKSKK
jgi:shikimate kinase